MRLTAEEHVQTIKEAVSQIKAGLRIGQAHMNALHSVRPDLYELVSNTDADCFYNDGKMIQFTEFIHGKDFNKYE